MIISSELTGKQYKTVEDCLKAERDYKKAKAEAEKAEKEREEAKEKAYDEAVEACKKYLKLAGVDVTIEEDKDEEKDEDKDDDWELIDMLIMSLFD